MMKLGAALGLLLLGVSVSQESKISLSVDFAWGGFYRVGVTGPVKVMIDNPGETFRGRLVLRWTSFSPGRKQKFDLEQLSGEDSMYYEMPLALPEKSRQVHIAYVPGDESAGQHLSAILVSEKDEIAAYAEATGFAVKHNQVFVGVVGERIPPLLKSSWERRAEVGHVRPADLPDRWYGYSGLDALVWIDGDPSLVRDSVQIEALRQWVVQGGRLIVVRGESAGLKGTWLADLLPATFRADGISKASDVLAGINVPKVSVGHLVLEARPGATVNKASAQWSVGRGRVHLIGVDLTREPFLDWDGMTKVWRSLVPEAPVKEEMIDPALAAVGSGTLLDASLRFSGVEAPSLAWAFTLIVLLVLLVGPGDYALLRILKRFELTWVTFPGMVLVFSAVALFGGGGLASGTIRGHELAVVDYYQDHGISRGWSMTTFLSIDQRRFTIESPQTNSSLLPLNSYRYAVGQSYGQSTGLATAPVVSSMKDKAAIRGWDLARGGRSVVLSEWCESKASGVFFEVEGTPGKEIKATLQNPMRAPVQRAILVHSGGVYVLNTIEPGKSVKSVSPGSDGLAAHAGCQVLGVTVPDDNYYYKRSYDPPETDPQGRRSILRGTLIGLSFADTLRDNAEIIPANSRYLGMARALESSRFVREGGWVLLGLAQLAEGVQLTPAFEPDSESVVLIRTFRR
jgi:hypothetical protein